LVEELAKRRKQRDAFKAWICESEATLDRVLNDLTEANEAKDHLATKLDSSGQEDDHGYRSEHHQGGKGVGFGKKDSFVSWLRDLAGSLSFHWGF